MKLSFSLPSKSSSNPNLVRALEEFADKTLDHGGSGDSKEYVNEFDASNPPSQTSCKSRKIVIPPLKNEWPPKRMKNLELPLGQSDESDLKFESASGLDRPDDSNISFGLNVRRSVEGTKSAPRPAPLEVVTLEKFKRDLKSLPDDNGFEDFEEVPVESFADALLESYGWRQGRGIGRNAKEDVRVKEYNPKTDRQGLGFVSDAPVGISKEEEKDNGRARKRNMDESRVKEDINGGGVKENRDRESDGLAIGENVRIVGGRDAGLEGRIVEKLDPNWLVDLKLSKREEQARVKVCVTDVAELGSKEEDGLFKKLED